MIQETIERWLRWQIENAIHVGRVLYVEYWAEPGTNTIVCTVLSLSPG